MKILRVRRGFTTNSSGANEYVESPSTETAVPLANQPGGVAAPTPAQPAPAAKPANPALAKTAAPGAPPASPTDQGMTGAATGQPLSCREACTGSTTIGNAFILLTFIFCVLLLFAVERVIRVVRRRPGKKDHESRTDSKP